MILYPSASSAAICMSATPECCRVPAARKQWRLSLQTESRKDGPRAHVCTRVEKHQPAEIGERLAISCRLNIRPPEQLLGERLEGIPSGATVRWRFAGLLVPFLSV